MWRLVAGLDLLVIVGVLGAFTVWGIRDRRRERDYMPQTWLDAKRKGSA